MSCQNSNSSCFAAGGRGERIGYISARSPFGWLMAAATGRGLCWLAFAGSRDEAEAELRTEFSLAELSGDPSLAWWIKAAIGKISREATQSRMESLPEPALDRDQPLDLRGSAFQLRVWQALRAIPRGETRSYGQLARGLGAPRAARAVANACAANRIALFVPCHRVVGADGSPVGYRWGVALKCRLLDLEETEAPAHGRP